MEEIKYQLIIKILEQAVSYDMTARDGRIQVSVIPYGDLAYPQKVILLKELDHYEFIVQEILEGGNYSIKLPIGEYKVDMSTLWDKDKKKKAFFSLLDQIDPKAKNEIIDKAINIPMIYESRIKVELKIIFIPSKVETFSSKNIRGIYHESVQIYFEVIKEDEFMDQKLFDHYRSLILMFTDNMLEDFCVKFHELAIIYPKFTGNTFVYSTFIESSWSNDQIKSHLEECLNLWGYYIKFRSFVYENKTFEKELKEKGQRLDWNEGDLKIVEIEDFDLPSREIDVSDLPDEAFEDWVEPENRGWEKWMQKKEKNHENE